MRLKWMVLPLVWVWFHGSGAGILRAQEAPAPVSRNVEEKAQAFTIDKVIHPVVAKLPPPEFEDGIVSIPMAVSSRSSLASRHVLQGLAYIQAAWDFEAYRHFCEAVKADPDCLMAYWGIGLALAAPNNEFTAQRQVAVLRMIELMDAEVEVGGKLLPVASQMEQRYALALAELFALRGNPQDGFGKLSADFPNNLQAKCLSIYLQRDGFDEFGPRAGQETAMKAMESVVKDNPDNVGVLTFWVMLHAEAPEATTKLREEILPVVRKIARKAPGFPPYQHLLGHFEWRCGNHFLAEAALSRAAKLYADHMKRHKLSLHDCNGWIRTQLYLATAMQSRGRFEPAMAIARNLARFEIDPERLGSSGANLVVWEARTLPARLYISRGQEGDFDRAIASLPGPKDPQLMKIKDRTLSIFYLECLIQYLECRRALEAGDVEAARKDSMTMNKILARMEEYGDQANKSSSISEYVRALTGLQVYAAEARGLIAQAQGSSGAGTSVARSWFKTAAEKQQRPSLLMPPVVVSPMERRLAAFYGKAGNYEKAAESYQAALRRRPNDLASLIGYRNALSQTGREEHALQVDKIITAVKQ